MSQKIDSYLVFANLGKNLVLGETLIKLLPRKKIFLIILAYNIGESQKKKFLDKAKFYRIPLYFYKSKEELALLLHKGSISSLGIKDLKLAQAIKKEMEGDFNAKKEN